MKPLRFLVLLLFLFVTAVGLAEPNGQPGPVAADGLPTSEAGTPELISVSQNPKASTSTDAPLVQPIPLHGPSPGDSAVAKPHPPMGNSAQNKDRNGLVMLAVAILLLIIAIGAAMGAKGTLVIYNGKLDLIISVALPIMAIIPDEMARIATCILLLISAELSCQGNHSLLKLLLIFPTKIGLPILTALSAIIALGSVTRLLKGETKDSKDTAMAVAIGVACAAGFHYLTKLIQQLIVTSPSSAADQPAYALEHQENS